MDHLTPGRQPVAPVRGRMERVLAQRIDVGQNRTRPINSLAVRIMTSARMSPTDCYHRISNIGQAGGLINHKIRIPEIF